MLKDPPLSSAFAAAVAVWTGATSQWLARSRARGWQALALFGLAFASTPTGSRPAGLWIAHSALLCALTLAFLALSATRVAAAPARVRRRARAHRAGLAAWCAAGLACVCTFRYQPPGLVRAYGGAACELAALGHLALMQWDIMKP
jgi:hypothetical protein